ncbi:hypothetical protein [Arthrobacter koreensis]|uniref:DoxX family protein n=1 Tax=Arthrobacter koreensis TaxID=199136 RepID=UPI002DBD52BE|nr:hypothetical protein [Arthrobacter koreensis]MEB7504333.1 hypothetical protein [Arthrobacter koreensis]
MSRSPLIRTLTARSPRISRPRRAAAVVLGLFLAFAGTSHLTFARDEFQAQVPEWVPMDKDMVVLLSGIAEIGLGSALALLPSRRVPVGLAAAAFFIAIFPGNISQYVTQTDGFGLDTDQKRFIRLFFQPLLVIWALWSTGAWQALRNLRRR